MAFVQANNADSGNGVNVSTFPCYISDVTAGNCLILEILWKGGDGDSLTVTDLLGNSWHKVYSYENGTSGLFMDCWFAPGIYGGPDYATVTVSGGTNITDYAYVFSEYSGVLQAGALDAYGYAWMASNAATVAASQTSVHSIDLLHVFGAFRANGAGSPTAKQIAVQSPLGYTQRVGQTVQRRSVYTFDQQVSTADTYPVTLSIPATVAVASNSFGIGLLALKMQGSPLTPGNAWLIIDEPIIGLTDRSVYMAKTDRNTFTRVVRERGTAQVSLNVPNGDSYAPTMGTQVYLYDRNSSGTSLRFAGTIDHIDLFWYGTNGYRNYTLTVTSFEQCLDVLLVPPQTFYYTDAASIFSQLFASIAGGVPFTLGTCTSGTPPYIVYQQTCNWERLTSVFDSLATQASCVWGIDIDTLTLFFHPPDTTAAPFTLTPSQIMWDSNRWTQNRADFRNRQVLKISPDAFRHSSEVFSFTGVPQTFTLLRALSQVTDAWYLKDFTAASQTGSLSALPANGDTVTIGYPSSGSIYNWQPNAPYYVGQIIIDPSGNVQQCNAGTRPGSHPPAPISGSSTPSWSGSIGGMTVDGGLDWTNLGPSGPGGAGASIYTFVAALDNTQWGQVLIDPNGSTIQTIQNLCDAIGCNANTSAGTGAQAQGVTFSWPTWENPLVNATCSGLVLTITMKIPGGGYNASLGQTGTAFAWDSPSGGGSCGTGGMNCGSTGNSIQLAVSDTGNTSNLYYTPGTQSCSMASRPNGVPASGGVILISYQRLNGDTIVVENTSSGPNSVQQRAIVEGGTGKYQVVSDDSSLTSNTMGLQYAQAALAAYNTLPVIFSFRALRLGLEPGQILNINMSPDVPKGIAALIAGNGYEGTNQYLIQEIRAKLIPVNNYLGDAAAIGAGRYEYTVTVINESQIFSYLAFWQQMASGGAGGSGQLVISAGSGSPGNVPSSGGSINPMGASGNLYPTTGAAVTNQATLTGAATIKPPALIAAGGIINLQLIQDATGGRAVTFDGFYTGLGAFTLNLDANTQATPTFQINTAGTSAALINNPQNGWTIT